jgi:hypothetical protein
MMNPSKAQESRALQTLRDFGDRWRGLWSARLSRAVRVLGLCQPQAPFSMLAA